MALAFAGWLAGLHGAPDTVRLFQRLVAEGPAHLHATAVTVYTAAPGHHDKLRRFDAATGTFSVLERRPGVVSSAWANETSTALAGTGGMNAETVEPAHDPSDHYLAVTVPAISLRHTAAVLLFTRPKAGPPFGADETATFAGLLREHMMIAIHAATRNDAMLRTLDLLLKSTDLDSVLALILRESAGLVNCARCSLFVLDESGTMLTARVFDERQDETSDKFGGVIKLRVSEGIAGLVATSGNPILLDNAYEHPNFNKSIDERTGTVTQSLLCVPMRRGAKILGVVQWINKLNSDGAVSTFSRQDLDDCAHLTSYYALALANAQLQDAQRKADRQTKVAMDMMAYHVVTPEEEVEALLATPGVVLSNYDGIFSPLWNANGVTDNETVPILAAMFGHLGYVERFNMTKTTLLRFLLTVRRAYRKVPYHNWRHAFSVAHFCFVVLATQSVHRYLEDHEQLGLLLAAVCHDIDHRGRNNAFMMKANNAIAQLYDAGSVMEHHHLAFTVTLLSDPAVNVLANVAPSVYTAVLQQVRHVILATDLATHFKERGAIRKLVSDMPAYDRTNIDHRHLLTSLIMTSSDLSSIVKPWEVTVEVTREIFTEFFMQGDEERAMGHTPNPMMDRLTAVVPQQQLGFIDAVAMDVYECLDKVFPTLSVAFEQLRRNRQLWDVEAQKQTTGTASTDPNQVRYLPTH